jgi:hypothetical protein
LGSFTFSSTTVDVTAGMVYGTPPLETSTTQLHDPKDLATHSIFETFFKEFTFTFDSTHETSSQFDAQATAYQGVSPESVSGTGAFWAKFAVDVSNLNSVASIHFDLYKTEVLESGDIDVSQFAPFSHDAQSGPGGSTSTSTGGPDVPGVPEPNNLSLLGLGLIASIFVLRRQTLKGSALQA